MTDRQMKRCIAQFRKKAAEARDRAAADRAFFELLTATAAKRAAADFAALERKAKFALEAEEPDEVRPRINDRVTDVRVAYATDIVASLDHVPKAETEIYWIASLMAHEKEFDRLLRGDRGSAR